jgi:hypothetical protein
MTRSLRWPLAVSIAASLVAAFPATGTTLLPADFAELVRGARAIAHGVVINTESTWVPGRRRIETLVTVAVRDYYKGDLGARIAVHVPGGRVGRYRSVLVGAPTLDRGEEVVLFLSARDLSTPYLLGLGQGVFRVSRSRESGDGLVAPLPVFSQSLTAQRVVRGDPSRRALSLRDFSRLIASILAAPAPAALSPRRDHP